MYGAGKDGSITLASSTTEGSRQPRVPPTFLSIHWRRASFQVGPGEDGSGDCSQTSPVLLSRTAALLNSARTVKRDAEGLLLSHRCV